MTERRGLCTWRIFLGAILLTMGPVVASATAAPLGGVPPNDLCEDAIRLGVPGSAVGFTNDATIDDEFPDCGTSITAPGIWYTVIGTGTRITASTCSDLTDYDTKISVYCNTCADPVCVGGNDDNCVPFGLLSTVQWCSQKGTEYLILVHGFGGQTGGFTLSIFDDGFPCDDPVDCAAGGVCGDPDAGNCFDPEGNGTPGCNDLACCEAVCAADSFCCDVEWDDLCAEDAAALCGDPVCPGEGSCFEANGTPGCDDEACCNKVCTIDPFCCDIEWDGVCADEALEICGVCGEPDGGNCFDPDGNGTPGCNDQDCCEAVCGNDPFCCVVEWDDLCAEDAAKLCGNPACPGEGSCFEANGTPGCDDEACCNKVCTIDPFCCAIEWDSACADQALEICGVCGEPDGGNCFDPDGNGTPGCNDQACCAAVCAADPFCCAVAWDGLCAEEAADLCGNLACPGEGSCFEANGTPGCDDEACCNKVCLFDPFCCNIAWDGACAGAAADLCGAPCPWDLDGPKGVPDGDVGVPDLLVLLGAWGPCDEPCPPTCPADFDGPEGVPDCDVGVPDLLTLLGVWGPCP